MCACQPSGPTVEQAGGTACLADLRRLCEHLARYLIRAPFSMNKIRYDSGARTEIYKTKLFAGANRNSEVFDPLDFLAAVTAHIPNRGEHLVRYYGGYSSV